MPYHRWLIVLVLLSSAVAFSQASSPAPASVPSDQEIAHLKARAESGDSKAQVKLGQLYEDGKGLPADFVAAANWYRKAAEQGDPAAQNSLGIMYRTGRGVDKDMKEAVRWYRKAAKQGYPSACFNLAAAYYNGDGIPATLPRAYAWFVIAQRAGSPTAAEAVQRVGEELRKTSSAEGYMQVGRLLEAGDEVPQDLAEAASWYRKAAETSDPEAEWKLGELYSTGRGVPKDSAIAASWRARALKTGSPQRMLEYGDMLRTGSGVSQDYKAAVKWYRKAAEAGSAAAMLNLGLMYAQGLGLSRDPIKAYALIADAWLSKQSIRSEVRPAASQALRDLEKTMSPAEIENARNEVKRRWPGVVFKTEIKK